MLKHFRHSVVLFALLLGATASAKEESLSAILNRPERLTMSEVAEVQSLIKAEVGIPLKSREGSPQAWLNVMVDGAPRIIAALEKAFPGATWAFLGRDTQPLADIFETFYTAIGSPNRVVRIGVSKATFKSSTPDDLVEMLQGYGLNFNKMDRPFILVDTVSKGFGTQGRQLLQAGYSHYQANVGHPANLLQHFNMVGLRVSTVGNGPHIPIENAKDSLAAETTRYRGRVPPHFGAEHKIITIEDNEQRFNESGYEHFVWAWNNSYGPLQRRNGRVAAIVGEAHEPNIRKSVLWLQKQILREFSSDAFIQRVQNEAKRLGFHFSECAEYLKN